MQRKGAPLSFDGEPFVPYSFITVWSFETIRFQTSFKYD